jgi:hypothetical protein
MIVYAGLVFATVLIAQPAPMTSREMATVSPVVIDDDAPALISNSLSQRSDI